MLRINTFVYFSGIPWEDSPSTGRNPLVSDAVDIGYVFGNPTVVQAQELYETSTIGSTYTMVGGDTPIPLNYTSTMFEYAWDTFYYSGYYVMLPLNQIIYSSSDFSSSSEYNVTYYFGGSSCKGIFGCTPTYYFEYSGLTENSEVKSNNYIPFVPLDQQHNNNYLYYGIFYTYYWYTLQNGQINTYFLVNGNIYNNPLPKSDYQWGCSLFGCYSANAILPEPPSTYIAQSYQNAYETAFVAEENSALNLYPSVILSTVTPSGFIDGTFGYKESMVMYR